MCDFVSQNQKLFDELDNLIDSLEVADESALIFVLKEAQGIFGYLPKEVQLHIADKLGVSPSKVYGVVSFYSSLLIQSENTKLVSVLVQFASLKAQTR